MSIGLVTDSTADLQPALVERYGLAMVPLVVNWDGQTLRDKLDLSTTDFYRRLRTSKSLPKTGAPSLAAFESVFRAQLARHDALISINLASRLSATYEVARRAAESVDPRRITVVDSGTVSIGESWLVDLAGRLTEQGLDVPAIVEQVEQARRRIRILVLVETLEFLQRGGRLGRASALAGTLLNVKPILSIRDGDVAPVARVRTMSNAMHRMVELVVGLGPVERLGVIDGDSAGNARQMERELRAHYPDLTIDRGELGPVLGTHGGPGVVGVGVFLAA